MAPAVPSVPSGGARAHHGITPHTSPVLSIKDALPGSPPAAQEAWKVKQCFAQRSMEGIASQTSSAMQTSTKAEMVAACQTLRAPAWEWVSRGQG